MPATSFAMRKVLPLLFVALCLGASPAGAATSAKKASKNPAFARTWAADSKAYEGKKVTTSVLEYGDTGMISSESSHAVVPMTTGSATGESGDEIPVVVPTSRLKEFLESCKPIQIGKAGAFGAKVRYPSITGTFVTLQGEPALVIGEVNDAVKAIKPSKLLAAQRAADTSEKAPAEEPAPAAKPDKKKKR